MDHRDPVTRQHFNQRITFRVAGTATFADIAFDADLAARITGALDGSIVNLAIGEHAVFTVTHPMLGQPAQRVLGHDDRGALVLGNSDLLLTETGNGIGTRMFGHQAYAAQALGLTEIGLCAGAGPDANGNALNGTYTWARCGFDAPLKLIVSDFFSRPTSLKGVRTVQEVMRSDEGRDWWRNRHIRCKMAFDLRVGSLSWQVLQAYLFEKGIRLDK